MGSLRYFYRSRRSMETVNWDRILGIALEEAARSRDSQVVVGAIFSSYVRDAAAEEHPGADVPPDPEQSFKDFLLDHPAAVWVIPRKRQDILVAHPQAAGEVARKVAPALLRRDLYQAFTDLHPSRSYWYEAESDRAHPVEDPGSLAQSPTTRYPIPSNTREEEVAIRRAFVESEIQSGEVADALREALDDGRPLSAFSGVLRENQISKIWHRFKFARLLQRVRDWSAEEGLPWRAGWIEPEHDSGSVAVAPSPGGTEIGRLIDSLDEEDMARIMVPLDIVAKLLAREKRRS